LGYDIGNGRRAFDRQHFSVKNRHDGEFRKSQSDRPAHRLYEAISDIPFAKDVANRLQAEAAFEKLLRDNELSPKDLLWYAPLLEVRYKSVAETIRKSRATQVLELASGFSLRGLAVTQDPKVTYVESDLEELTDEKASLVADLRRQYRLAEHGNLQLVTADALDRNQLESAAKRFRRDQPIAVVNEGLLLYLSATEMAMVAGNIRDLLIEFDGVWITPDFSLKQDVKDVSEQQRRFRRVVAAATERTMYNNAFESDEQLLAFFDGLGLQPRVLNQVDTAPNVVSLDVLKLSSQILDTAKPKLRLWVLSVDHVRQ
jgi:O-methyltransferase involved in polyketide biosynthesis